MRSGWGHTFCLVPFLSFPHLTKSPKMLLWLDLGPAPPCLLEGCCVQVRQQGAQVPSDGGGCLSWRLACLLSAEYRTQAADAPGGCFPVPRSLELSLLRFQGRWQGTVPWDAQGSQADMCFQHPAEPQVSLFPASSSGEQCPVYVVVP